VITGGHWHFVGRLVPSRRMQEPRIRRH
jgi:hypothetical protein